MNIYFATVIADEYVLCERCAEALLPSRCLTKALPHRQPHPQMRKLTNAKPVLNDVKKI